MMKFRKRPLIRKLVETMQPFFTSRAGLKKLGGAILLLSAMLVFPMRGQRSGMHSAPSLRSPQRPQKQEHLSQWMQRHSNLPLGEQQRALQSEPGFSQLPPATQQRMLDRLTQLNNMSPEQRRRILDRTEAMEHLTLPQRQQFREAMQQLRGLPIDRRRLIARAFRDLREMPPQQRATLLASDRFRGQFTDDERATLSSLLAVEPYLPTEHRAENDPFEK